ncbi:MAG: ATP-dependent 6-phosphofructokinase [Planctomycetes bacterium]|nr:ATP-dependent 6-phosphofructokinase [Planctomycetota bacterium]MBI3833121.1 ATP-dependent 6-phosphofructokinase [Planctomycetota bacterium]
MTSNIETLDFSVCELGPRRVPSPYRAHRYVCDDARTLLHHTTTPDTTSHDRSGEIDPPGFELAGPRERIYFDPSKLRCGIVTCGGLCPGLNDVIRAIVLQLHDHYGVGLIYGFRYGFEGLVPRHGHRPLMLDPDTVAHIHQQGGSILSSSRGPQAPEEMVDALERQNLQVLFCIGGDGTFRGVNGLKQEIERRGLKIAVVAVPKTIDNDIPHTSRTFGFETAYSEATKAIRAAHVEAMGALNGVGLVKLMGRHAGFIAAHAVLASRDADFVLVPEVEFELAGANGLLAHLARRLKARRHAVVVVAEGAGQRLFDSDPDSEPARDPSGNLRLQDIGAQLRDRIGEYLRLMGIPHTLKYIDPSYLVRSAPATPSDSLFAGILGQMAAHAAMAGKTGMFVGFWNDEFTHVPISAVVSQSKRLDPQGHLWQSVLECTGQPARMTNDGAINDDAESAELEASGFTAS